MSFPYFKQSILLIALYSLLSGSLLARDDWRVVTNEERQMTQGKVEADADAEAIFWEVTINDAGLDLVMEHYIRVKILTERGREKFSKIDINYRKGVKIKDIEARVIKPDNSIVELAKEDIFDREIVKTDDVKFKAKSFAVPNIEPGVIVEYRYTETHKYGSADNFRMDFQRDIPMQKVVYRIKTYRPARPIQFNVDAKFIEEKNKWHRIEMKNMPAIKEEPNMPPEDEIRSWLLVYYDSKNNVKAEESDFWSRINGYLVGVYDVKDTLKPGKKMKAAAEAIIGSAVTEEEKIRKLFDFCKTKIRNLHYDTSLTEDQLDEIKPNKDSDDTYKKLQGRSNEINRLFASLADAAGFETRFAFTGDRRKIFFNPNRMHESFVHMAGIAVKLDNTWEYFDPGSPYLPYKKLAWYEEDTTAFLLAYEDSVQLVTPTSDYDYSKIIRSGKFKLTEDGTLEGTATIKYTGHYSYRYKLSNYDSSVSAREDSLKEYFKGRMSTAELSNISILNVTDYDEPFTYKFDIKVPNYAQAVGKRIFLQPGFFTFGSQARFSSSTRKYDIFFNFPWSESEKIEIQLPDGYKLDNPDAPPVAADNSKISSLAINMTWDQEKNVLNYGREFYFGGKGITYFKVGSYDAIKGLFDVFHKNDTHSLTLIKEPTAD